MKYTVGSLIDKLNKFPKDLCIATDLAIMFTYPDEIYDEFVAYESEYKSDDILNAIACAHASSLCIFEGDWETGISNLNGDFEKYRKIREE